MRQVQILFIMCALTMNLVNLIAARARHGGLLAILTEVLDTCALHLDLVKANLVLIVEDLLMHPQEVVDVGLPQLVDLLE